MNDEESADVGAFHPVRVCDSTQGTASWELNQKGQVRKETGTLNAPGAITKGYLSAQAAAGVPIETLLGEPTPTRIERVASWGGRPPKTELSEGEQADVKRYIAYRRQGAPKKSAAQLVGHDYKTLERWAEIAQQ